MKITMKINEQEFISIKDFMKITGMCRDTIKKAIREKRLKGLNILCKYWISKEEIEKLK